MQKYLTEKLFLLIEIKYKYSWSKTNCRYSARGRFKNCKRYKRFTNNFTGERFTKLEQLRGIKSIDWDEIFKENLVRVD